MQRSTNLGSHARAGGQEVAARERGRHKAPGCGTRHLGVHLHVAAGEPGEAAVMQRRHHAVTKFEAGVAPFDARQLATTAQQTLHLRCPGRGVGRRVGPEQLLQCLDVIDQTLAQLRCGTGGSRFGGVLQLVVLMLAQVSHSRAACTASSSATSAAQSSTLAAAAARKRWRGGGVWHEPEYRRGQGAARGLSIYVLSGSRPAARFLQSRTPEPETNTMSTFDEKSAELRRSALEYHEFPTPGKIAIAPTKQLINQRDLALAYSPGVAAACEEIVADPANAFRYTARGNLVAVVTNGTAVLGLGDIGPLASKPVMEGKGVLFKKFAGIDVFDLELEERNLDKLVDIIAALEPTFGGINLEDIKAPDCFYVERKLRERMKIPVFHDDQHGTAIVVGAAMLNGLKVIGKDIKQVKLVSSGAGAAALACLNLLVKLGMPRENIFVTDLAGVVYKGRVELMDPDKAEFAQDTPAPHAARGDRRRRHLPGSVGRWRAQGRHGGQHGPAPADLRAGQPQPRDPARGRQGGARRRHHGHRPHRLPEPGQQRPVLPVHLPRRARLRRHHHHRRDGSGGGARDCRTRPGRAERGWWQQPTPAPT